MATTVDLSELPPGPTLPRRRQAARWAMRPLAFQQELRDRYGDVFTVSLGEDPWVIVGDPELVKQVFAAPADVLHAGEGNRALKPLFGSTALLLRDGEEHIRHRRLLMPPFKGDHVKTYEETMRAVVTAEVDRWPPGIDVAAWPRLQAMALEAIMRVVLGGMAEADLLDLREAMLELRVPAAPGERVELTGFHGTLEHANELVVAEIGRRREGSTAPERRDDVLDLLLGARHQDGSTMTDTEIRNELTMLLITGHETTATTLAWALERLARTPAALERTAAEADGGGGPYTEAVIRETLRMRPVLPLVARLTKRPFRLGRYRIPPGAIIAPSVLLVHHRPDVYPDPEEFRPERFLERSPGTYTWIPFGGGVRRCIGAAFALLEMRIVLSTLLSRATVRAPEPAPEAMRSRVVTLTPARGARLILEARER